MRQQLVDIVEHACFREFAAETAGLATLDERALRLLEAVRARPGAGAPPAALAMGNPC